MRLWTSFSGIRPKMKSTNKLSKKLSVDKTFFSLAYNTSRRQPDEDDPIGVSSSADVFFGSPIRSYIPIPPGTILRLSDEMKKHIQPHGGHFLFFIKDYVSDREEPVYSMTRTNGRSYDEHEHSARFIHVMISDKKLLYCTVDEAAKLVLLG
jgi:hypothetical protein